MYLTIGLILGFSSVLFLWMWSVLAVRSQGLKMSGSDFGYLAAFSVGCILFGLLWPLVIVAMVVLIVLAFRNPKDET